MAVSITYYVHGTTTDNELGLATGWLAGELSSLGIQQSKELRRQTKQHQFAALFSSDLRRAIDSARLAFEPTIKHHTDKRLREINYGDWNGQPDTFKNKLASYIKVPFPHGECFRDVEMRVADLLNFLRENFDGKRIAIMAHQAPQLALEVLCNGKSWAEAIRTDWRRVKAWQPGWEYDA